MKYVDSTLLILFCCFIFWLSDQSTLPTPLKFPYQDKVMHMGGYFILTAFTVRAFRHLQLSYGLFLASCLMFSSLYGVSDEWHQSFVPNRLSDFNDWLADTVGAILLLTLYHFYRKKNKSTNFSNL